MIEELHHRLTGLRFIHGLNQVHIVRIDGELPMALLNRTGATDEKFSLPSLRLDIETLRLELVHNTYTAPVGDCAIRRICRKQLSRHTSDKE